MKVEDLVEAPPGGWLNTKASLGKVDDLVRNNRLGTGLSNLNKEFSKKFQEMATSDPTAITVDNTARDVSTFDKSVKDAEALMQNTKIEAPGSSTASGLSNYLAGLNNNEFF